MVRRWSRINTSNCADYFDYNIAYRVHHLKVFRTTTYFKRFYFGWTKQKRRKSALKKRLSYLTPYMNVIGMWAKDYRFFRHVTRFNYTSNVFLVNYIANNNMSYANIQTLHSVKFDSFITASYANRVSRYYTRQQSMAFFCYEVYTAGFITLIVNPRPVNFIKLRWAGSVCNASRILLPKWGVWFRCSPDRYWYDPNAFY